jgi:hypothetical protein
VPGHAGGSVAVPGLGRCVAGKGFPLKKEQAIRAAICPYGTGKVCRVVVSMLGSGCGGSGWHVGVSIVGFAVAGIEASKFGAIGVDGNVAGGQMAEWRWRGCQIQRQALAQAEGNQVAKLG